MKLGKLTRVGTLLLLVAMLVSGCSSGANKVAASNNPDPTSTSSGTQTEKPYVAPKIDYNSKIVAAKNPLELEFLTIALASCEKAQTDGFTTTFGDSVSYFSPANEGIFPYWPFDEVNVSNGVVGPAVYTNYYPGLFFPCDIERGQRYTDSTDFVALEHKVTANSDGTYSWFQHQGGYSLEETRYSVKNGLIAGYDDVSIGYGPFTSEQQSLFDQVKK